MEIKRVITALEAYKNSLDYYSSRRIVSECIEVVKHLEMLPEESEDDGK